MSVASIKDRLKNKGREPDTPAKPPKHLRKPTREWWAKVAAEYEFEPHHFRLLTLAAESWDRCEQARKLLRTKGITYDDRFGQPCSRPEISIERDSRIAFARLVRELNLDAEPPSETPRRPKLRY
jgi:phage terminase small subunit